MAVDIDYCLRLEDIHNPPQGGDADVLFAHRLIRLYALDFSDRTAEFTGVLAAALANLRRRQALHDLQVMMGDKHGSFDPLLNHLAERFRGDRRRRRATRPSPSSAPPESATSTTGRPAASSFGREAAPHPMNLWQPK